MRGALAQATRQDLVTEPSVAELSATEHSGPTPQSTGRARHIITAVVVAHDGARLLPGLIHAVREQTHPVQRVVGVDTGSRDRSGATLTELLGQDAVFGMDPETGYGTAIASALEYPAARAAAGAGGPAGATEWIWLLHDDCEPAPDALEQLLAGAGRSRSRPSSARS